LLLADNHPLLLEGIRLMLELEFGPAGNEEDGHSLPAAAKTLKPDIILLDLAVPALSGIDAAVLQRIRAMAPQSIKSQSVIPRLDVMARDRLMLLRNLPTMR
jgi:DNA-binding NarL/FixJ family response regulator